MQKIQKLIINFAHLMVNRGMRCQTYPVNHTSWMAVVTPTARPKSVRNRCVIELLCGVVCAVTLPFWHFCWCGGFCHRTESDLFLFLLLCTVQLQFKLTLSLRRQMRPFRTMNRYQRSNGKSNNSRKLKCAAKILTKYDETNWEVK